MRDFGSVLGDEALGDPGAIGLRRLRSVDLPILRTLAEDSVVMDIWDDDADGIVAEIEEHLDDDVVTPFLIVNNHVEIGYIQCYHANADDFWSSRGVPAETFGIDLFIAGEHLRNRGLGTRAIQLLVDRLWQIPEVVLLQIDPDPAHHRAIRAYAKVGFVAQFEAPGYEDAPMLYMTMSRPSR